MNAEAESWIRDTPRGAVLALRVVPRSSRDKVDGVPGAALKVRLQAPPVEGRANRELARFLASALGVSASRIVLLGGDTARNKVVLVSGLSGSDVRSRLGI